MGNLINFISNGGGNGNGGGGNGNGNGYGDGNGNGHGYGIKKINGMPVACVDGLPMAIKQTKGNTARGYAFDRMQLVPCWIVKQDNIFAHGKTLRKAVEALRDKLFCNMPTEERIEAFLTQIDIDKEYKAKTFYDWHHKLTGSCEFGRNEFIKRHNINLNDDMTVDRFVELTENSYGGGVIKELKQQIQNKRN